MSYDWLEPSLFEQILNRDVGTFHRINKFEIASGSGVGENYSSVMCRVVAEVERNDHSTTKSSYMLKLSPEKDNSIYQYIKNGNFFKKENLMFDEVIPAFEKLYSDIGHTVRFGPENFHLNSNLGKEVVITADLGLQGFSNASRLEGLNMHQCNAALGKLAKFHAASSVFFEEHGPYNEVFNINLFVESSQSIFEDFNRNIMESMEPCVKGLCENGEYFSEKIIQKDIKKYVKHLMKSEDIDYSEFNVLNHGDFWSNNILFQYNEKSEVNETLFIDFQMCKYGSPALDLFYFIFSSSKIYLKVNEFDNFINYYHRHLVENLKLLNYTKPIPQLADIHKSLLNHGIWAKLPLCGVMAAALLDPNEQATLDG